MDGSRSQLFFAVVLALTKPIGLYMAHVFERERTFADPLFAPVERLLYRLTRIRRTMRWLD
jgi:K+-transporting ATPase ATPase A chain